MDFTVTQTWLENGQIKKTIHQMVGFMTEIARQSHSMLMARLMMAVQARTYVGGPNSSGNSLGGGNSAVAQVKAAGARWFTKGNILYWRVKVNGKMTDIPNSKYYIERDTLLLS